MKKSSNPKPDGLVRPSPPLPPPPKNLPETVVWIQSPLPIEERIDRIEKALNQNLPGHILPGTTLIRGMTPKDGDGMQWQLGIGYFLGPLKVFTGKTIVDCIEQAEWWVKNCEYEWKVKL